MARYTAFKRLEPFDRTKQFVAKRPVRVSGKKFGYGDVIDKTKLSTRRLRQLYEQRSIVMSDDGDRPNFSAMEYDELFEWLRNNGRVVRYGASIEHLVKRANEFWSNRNGK